MKQLPNGIKSKNSLITLIECITLLFILLIIPYKANATLENLSLNNVTFTDGGYASGTFTYDPTTQLFTNVQVTVTDSVAQQLGWSNTDTYLMVGGMMLGPNGIQFSSPTNQSIYSILFLELSPQTPGSWDIATDTVNLTSFQQQYGYGAIQANGALGSIEYSNTDPAPVPEPGTMMLLGLGMAGLAVYGKRRANKA